MVANQPNLVTLITGLGIEKCLSNLVRLQKSLCTLRFSVRVTDRPVKKERGHIKITIILGNILGIWETKPDLKANYFAGMIGYYFWS
jgi:hypothetical protein